MTTEPWSETEDGLILTIRVSPKASKTRLAGIFVLADGQTALSIRVAAPPVDGAANAELIAFLSKALGLRKSDLALAAGETSRHKKLLASGDPAAIADKLRTLLPG